MLRAARDLAGYSIHATDGDIGEAHDLLFDASWRVRYVVVDTGKWLSGRKVVIPPDAFEAPDWFGRVIPVRLTKTQVESSPELAHNAAVSRGHEEATYRHYGWPPYWIPPIAATMNFIPQRAVYEERAATEVPREREQLDNEHQLASVRDVTGYRIATWDGEIGRVEDFVIDLDDLAIRQIVVDTRDWLPGKQVLIPVEKVDALDVPDEQVHLDMKKDDVRHGEEFDAFAPVNVVGSQAYDYYGRPVERV